MCHKRNDCIKVTSEASELSESALVDSSLAVKNIADSMSSLYTSNMTRSAQEDQARFVIYYLSNESVEQNDSVEQF